MKKSKVGMYCIYRTTNLINGKTYIGQHHTDNLNDSYLGSGIHLKRSIEKYGRENFKKEIIISGDFSKEQIDKFERCAITLERLNGKAEYNIANGGQGGNLGEVVLNKLRGQKRTEEFKRRNSEVHKGLKHSEETKRKISENHSHCWLGRKHSEETKREISDARKGKKHSEEHKRKISETKKKQMFEKSQAYKEYKQNGGTLNWKEFLKEYKKQPN